jgi:hypothetical protein
MTMQSTEMMAAAASRPDRSRRGPRHDKSQPAVVSAGRIHT